MKACPICQRTYDEAEKFCLHDGMALVALETDNSSAEIKPETGLSSDRSETSFNQRNPESLSPLQPQSSAQNTGFVIALSVIATALLIGVLGGGSYWLMTREAPTGNVNTTEQAQAITTSNAMFNSPAAVQRGNSANTSSSSINPSPSTPDSTESGAAVRREVSDALFRWKADAEELNFTAYMDNYAETVDYYRAGKSDRSRVSKDKQRAFRLYNSINIKLNNIRIMPEASGNQATVILDKAWNFKAAAKSSEGEVEQQLILKKINERWYIAGEKDLKVYYSRSY